MVELGSIIKLTIYGVLIYCHVILSHIRLNPLLHSSRNSLYNIPCRTLSTGVIDKQRDNISTNANIIVSTPSTTLKVNNSLQAQHRQIRLRNQMKSIFNQLTTQFNNNSKF